MAFLSVLRSHHRCICWCWLGRWEWCRTAEGTPLNTFKYSFCIYVTIIQVHDFHCSPIIFSFDAVACHPYECASQEKVQLLYLCPPLCIWVESLTSVLLWSFSLALRKTRSARVDPFDARGIFDLYGNEEWGEYCISEAHLSQRFAFDENGYYHCCASIPFPENVQKDWSTHLWDFTITKKIDHSLYCNFICLNFK